MKTTVYSLLVIILFITGCCKRQEAKETKTRYYMYGYYENNWLLVRNAVIIKEEVMNDSVSRLQITNHNRTVENELGISTFYDKKLFQKLTPEGIYFSEDSVNYDLFFDFNFGEKIQTNFPVYYFFGTEPKEIRLDTIKDYLKEKREYYLKEKEDKSTNAIETDIVYQPKQNYNDYRSYEVYSKERTGSKYCQVLFDKKLLVPLFGSDIVMQDYYLLTDVIGVGEGDKYLDEAREAIWSDKLRWSGEGVTKEMTYPFSWWHKIIEKRYKK